MHYYLTLTTKCNLLCKYCYGKSVEDYLSPEEEKNYDLNIPSEIQYSINNLKEFFKDDKELKITFYGGEPLLRINLIKKIMDEIPAKSFMLQTNGIFLDKLDSKYLNKMPMILVSIDGTKNHTNERRGNLVYEKIIKNLKFIRKNGFNGEIIARMTVDETSNIFENVKHLYENEEFPFSSIHWQIDAQFWKSDYETRNFKYWVDNDYNPNIKKLLMWWLNKIKQEKRVPKIYPFIGIVHSILNNEKAEMRCGAGHSVLGIQTDGTITACPITAGCKSLYQGDIKKSNLKSIKENKIVPDGLCLNCEIKDICGGRCLYANKTMLWGENGFKEVCSTVFYLVNSIKKIIPEIEKLIENKIIKKEDFNYEKYNGVEIIP